MILYKYRSLDNIKFLIDIFLNKRLFAASYTQMNDPMEGHYFYRSGSLTSDFKSILRGEKDALRICSLSAVHDNDLMWAHYANGYKGIAIGVKINNNKYAVEEIEYGELGAPLTPKYINQPEKAAQKILSHKLAIWDYEKEYRVFVRNSNYIDIKIKEVIFGRRVSDDDRIFFEKLFRRLYGNIEFKREG